MGVAGSRRLLHTQHHTEFPTVDSCDREGSFLWSERGMENITPDIIICPKLKTAFRVQ